MKQFVTYDSHSHFHQNGSTLTAEDKYSLSQASRVSPEKHELEKGNVNL